MRGFDAKFLDELKFKNDIVDVVGRYVHLEQKGSNFWGRCPFHHEKTASFIHIVITSRKINALNFVFANKRTNKDGNAGKEQGNNHSPVAEHGQQNSHNSHGENHQIAIKLRGSHGCFGIFFFFFKSGLHAKPHQKEIQNGNRRAQKISKKNGVIPLIDHQKNRFHQNAEYQNPRGNIFCAVKDFRINLFHKNPFQMQKEPTTSADSWFLLIFELIFIEYRIYNII